MALIDLTGKTFGRYFVKGLTAGCGKVKFWDCRCECGTEKSVLGGDLKRGMSKSCGCLMREVAATRITTHGMSFHPAYRNWLNAKTRCYNLEGEEYPNYGGRGIIVCERWIDSFENFWEDMGPTWQKGLSLDRYPDVNGDYEKNNCRWATAKMQANNRREHRIIDTPLGPMNVTQASEAFGISRNTLMKRISSGRPESEWFGQPRDPSQSRGKYGPRLRKV